jgi:hypothetical protein
MTLGVFITVGLLGAAEMLFCRGTAQAATPGLPFTENFASDNLKDPGTTATWSTAERQVYLAWGKAQHNVFGPDTTGTNITADAHVTTAIAVGDVDGDGHLDVVAGNYSQPNRLYLNNGTSDPFNGVTGTDITADAHNTLAIALGDVDGDGDLDVVAGNDGQASRLYLNNGTVNPFSGVIGTDITTDAHNTYAIALGDLDGDGDLDVVAGNSGQTNRLYLNNGTASPFSGVAGTDITPDAHYTYAIALGDLDGDGDLDIVAGNVSGQNRLYLNNGTANPFSGVTGSDITTDAQLTKAIALGDVDGDGDLDIVAGNYNQANRLYLNNGTANPFNGVTGTDITADASQISALALGDVDGDGDLDVVTVNEGQANRLYLNNGTATPFSGAAGMNITGDAPATRAIALVDIDGDGDLDVVTGNNGQANRLYLNNGNSDPFSGVTGTDITADADRTWCIALGDMDGDGDLDVVVGDLGPGRLYLNNGTANPFSGVTGTVITTDLNWNRTIALGDVDGDGHLDVVFGNNYGETNRLYLNNGTADPFTGVSGTDITADTYDTLAIALGDVDGDGDLDVVTGNEIQANRLYLNNGTADPFSGVTGTNITADSQNTAAIALGDVDGDGDLDVVAGNNGEANRLYLNNGAADPFNGVTGTDITTDAQQTLAIALGDVDGDGDLDVVAANPLYTNRLYLNNGTANPFSGVTGTDITSDANFTMSIALGDMDGDGDLDVVVGNSSQVNRLYLNNGTPNPFSGVTGTDITADAQGNLVIALGDVDGDGNLDVAAGNWFQVNRLYLNNGAPNPFNGVTGTNITADANAVIAIAFGDVDGDGDLDVVAGNVNQTTRLYLNNGTPNPFGGVTGTDITADAGATYALSLGDVDGDGHLDVVVGNWNQANRLYLNNGTLSPFAGVTGTDITADAHAVTSIALGDVDGDGDLDVVTGNSGEANRLYLNNGTADPFSGVTGTDITADAHTTQAIALGDVDGDGDPDVVAGNSSEANRLYLNNGTADPFLGVSGTDITAEARPTREIALGDVDGDGDLDVVAGNYNEVNRLYLNNGTAAPFSGVTGADITADASKTWAIALGDADGDGDLDVVAGNLDQTNRLYLNNGTATPFSGVTGTDITAEADETRSIAFGDVDGDGGLDVVAGNYNQGIRLYRRELYQASRGMVRSLGVDAEAGTIKNARLTPSFTTPANTWVDWYLTNTGGAQWFQVSAGENFFFPTSGSDLRWMARLHSLSPHLSPVISQVEITMPPSHVLWTNSGTGQAIRWEVDPVTGAMNTWGWVSAPSGVGAGWQASSYARGTTADYVLWANSSTGQAIRWNVDPTSASITGWNWISPTTGVGAGWQASSYARGDATTDYVLWTNGSTGQAIRWKVDPVTAAITGWGWISAPSGVGAGWEASSYERGGATTDYVLWAKGSTGQAIRWKIDPTSGAVTGWNWISPTTGVGAGWQASSYARGGATTDYVLWTNGNTGQAIRWKVDPVTGAMTGWGWISPPSGVGGGWLASSYLASESLGALSEQE